MGDTPVELIIKRYYKSMNSVTLGFKPFKLISYGKEKRLFFELPETEQARMAMSHYPGKLKEL